MNRIPLFEYSSTCSRTWSSSSSSSTTDLSLSRSLESGNCLFQDFGLEKFGPISLTTQFMSRPISFCPISTRTNHHRVFKWHMHPRSLLLLRFRAWILKSSSWLFIYWFSSDDLESILILIFRIFIRFEKKSKFR